jgi:hypothetical protein
MICRGREKPNRKESINHGYQILRVKRRIKPQYYSSLRALSINISFYQARDSKTGEQSASFKCPTTFATRLYFTGIFTRRSACSGPLTVAALHKLYSPHSKNLFSKNPIMSKTWLASSEGTPCVRLISTPHNQFRGNNYIKP